MATNYIEWNYLINENLQAKQLLLRTETRDHPLKNVVVTERIPRRILSSQPSTGRTTPISTPSQIMEPLSIALEGLDPLTAFAIEEMDPLSKIVAEENRSRHGIVPEAKKVQDSKSEVESWTSRKSAILSKFTTSEKISIVTSFLSEGEKVIVKAQSTAVDKIQHRLEQLDYFEEGSQRKLDLSQTEYVSRIEQLNKELVIAWNSEQRVKALKIAIQCAKLLADTDVLRFYPSKFVLITDILDIFGQLVYNRLRTKAGYYKPASKKATALPEDFTPDMVPDSAKETCLNWFYKIASIRELVPRLYVEMALLKSYTFLSSSEPQEALVRLTKMISGIGNPLVALYARCYLCRVGIQMPSITNKQYLLNNFYEFLKSYHHLFSRGVKADLINQKMSLSIYMSLYTPGLDYILQLVANEASESLLNSLLEKCKTQGNSSLILNSIMSAFRPNLIATRSLQFLEMIEQCLDQGIPLHILLRTLGLCISVASPPIEHRRQVLNIAWKHIRSLNSAEEYILAVEAWAPCVVQYFAYREINTMLGDIIEHLTPERNYELYYTQLKHIVEKIVGQVQDFEMLVSMENFLPLVDLFQQESMHVEVCKNILTNCSSDHAISDPVVVHALMHLCTVLHDSINALIPDDEFRQIGEILCRVIKMIDYGRDFEQQLSFYVEARGAFSNIDTVFIQLVQCVNLLSVNTRQVVKGSHTKKTGDFVRACAAYCFITIPSIKLLKARLELYLLSGQVALFNQCLGQADACFKAALNTLSELKTERIAKFEPQLITFVKQFLSILLVVPDNPDCSVLYLTRTLLNILQSHEWEDKNSLIIIYLSVIDLLSAMAQENYIYHVDKVESNDLLYGSDPKFLSEINKMCSVVIGEILTYLKQLGVCQKQAQFALELFYRISLRSDLSGSLLTLALNLWNISAKNEMSDKKSMMKIKDYLKCQSLHLNSANMQELVERLNV